MIPRGLPDHMVMHGPPVQPKLAARRLAADAIHGEFAPEALHTYTDRDGRPHYWRIRARLHNGDKWIRPMSVQGMIYTLTEPSELRSGSKPLYRLHEIASADPAKPVWFVEGETCADALADLGFVATTAGSATSDDHADFSPLSGRSLILWPDNDAPGGDHMARVASKVRPLGCCVEIVDIDRLGLPAHGDVVNYLAAHPGATAADLLALTHISPAGDSTAPAAASSGADLGFERGTGDAGADASENISQASRLVRFVLDRGQLFRDKNADTYARDKATGEVRRLDGRGFRDWIRAAYFKAEYRSASEHAVSEAIATLSGIARFDGELRRVHVRCAEHDHAYWLDLGEAGSSRAVRIDAAGWRVVDAPACMFVRFEPMQPLSLPTTGGSISELWRLVNIPEQVRLLVVTWLIESLRPDTPFPVLELIGEQGSAKSTTQMVLRRLIDPNAADLRAVPKSVEDAFVAAGSQWLVSFENVSHLPAPMQDAFCILATGGGYAKRKLYTDADESVITVKRPIVLNGISANVTQQDLLDRCISVELPNIAERRDMTQLQADIDNAIPRIMGALFNIMAAALAALPRITLPAGERPRLIEFAQLGCAIAEVISSTPAEFMRQFNASRQDGIARTIDASPVATAVLSWLDKNPAGRRDTAGALYESLDQFRPNQADNWPRTPKGLGDALRRAAPALRALGVEVASHGRTGGHIYWSIRLSARD